MRSNRKKPQEEQDKVPAWIVSFSDMITLLLAFFVLLQSIALEQDPALFHMGQSPIAIHALFALGCLVLSQCL